MNYTIKTTLLTCLLLMQASCNAETTSILDFKSLPGDVLYGTDVKRVGDFKPITPEKASGSYKSEQGGAEVVLKITADNSKLILVRSFKGPGMPAEVKTYEINNYSNSQFQGTEIYGLFVKKGVLLLESKSQSFGIPNDMWIHYNKTE